MGRVLTLASGIALGLMLSVTMGAFNDKDTPAGKEVIKITKAEWAAEMSKNVSKSLENVHENCTIWVPEFPNRLDGKDAIYKMREADVNSPGSILLAEMANEKVQVFGNTAILTYNYMGVSQDKDGQTKPSLAKSSRVYVNEGGKWLLVHANFAPVVTPD